MSKFCENCGTELNEKQDVCLKCGVRINKEEVVKTKTLAEKQELAGFILGLVSSVTWLLPLVGYPTAICGLVFSAKGLKNSKSKGKATAGLVLSIIFLTLTFINSVLGVIEYYDSILY